MIDKRELRKIRKDLDRIEHEINVTARHVDRILGKEGKPDLPDWAYPRLNVWKEIHAKGGIVTKEELHRIASKYHIDNRGLGGFFSGKNSSLTKLSDGRIALTNSATKRMKEWGEISEDEEE